MKRREFLKHSATGLAVVAVASLADWPRFWSGSRAYAASAKGDFTSLELEMIEVEAEMVDEIEVDMWAFRLVSEEDNDEEGIFLPRIPGPALVALEGDRIRLKIVNHIDAGGSHGFAIPGVDLIVNGESMPEVTIPADDDGLELEFIAPAPGTYLYLDPLNAPVNRVMGLHGALVVLPQPVGGNGTPYKNPTANIQKLFDDLGTTTHFPGHPWNSERNAVWVFNAIDPIKCNLAADSATAIPPAQFLSGFLPQYFTLNGKSGFFAAQHHHDSADADGGHHGGDNQLSFGGGIFDTQTNISIRGRIGEPILLRTLNAGLAWHSPHIHGNHVYLLTDTSGTPLENLFFVDTWSTPPMARKDVLLTFIRPPDIPPAAWPPVEERFPLYYPAHDHNEISNTAAGGNYPHGLVTHWQIDGDIDPMAIVIFADQADLRVRTGLIELSGRISRTPAQVGEHVRLMVHAGGPDGAMLGHAMVDSEGRWTFRTRALRAIATRIVTLTYHDPDDSTLMHASRTVPLRVR